MYSCIQCPNRTSRRVDMRRHPTRDANRAQLPGEGTFQIASPIGTSYYTPRRRAEPTHADGHAHQFMSIASPMADEYTTPPSHSHKVLEDGYLAELQTAPFGEPIDGARLSSSSRKASTSFLCCACGHDLSVTERQTVDVARLLLSRFFHLLAFFQCSLGFFLRNLFMPREDLDQYAQDSCSGVTITT